jgi:hypothetical protein
MEDDELEDEDEDTAQVVQGLSTGCTSFRKRIRNTTLSMPPMETYMTSFEQGGRVLNPKESYRWSGGMASDYCSVILH